VPDTKHGAQTVTSKRWHPN